ncbi:MAG: LuxR C-terminal-related transcriptional regulator, partial [Chloroflexi bacterium]|nr:LuxR C-terminal-related transcriptional regulator [Chloroflexota bacterium]
ASQQMLDYERAAQIFEWIVREAVAAGDPISEILGISGRAQMLLLQGRLRLAFEVASDGVRRLEAGGAATPFSATLYGELGQIYYYWRQLEQARAYIQRSVQTSGRSGYSDPEIFYHLALSRMHQMEGDWQAAALAMQEASELARCIPPAMVREEVIAQQVRVHLAFGRLAEAQALLEAEGFGFAGGLRTPQLAEGAGVVHTQGLLYNSALRILLEQSRARGGGGLGDAIQLAGRVLAGELQCRHLPVALETLLLRSQLYAALGDERASLADAARALELAEPEGFLNVFLEEGAPVAAALAALLERGLLRKPLAGFAKQALAAFPAALRCSPPAAGRAAQELVEPLTGRELEVLRRIAAGDSNQAIAERLVITLSAVKKHTHNIYAKLGVSSRTQAVVRARQLNLLPAA